MSAPSASIFANADTVRKGLIVCTFFDGIEPDVQKCNFHVFCTQPVRASVIRRFNSSFAPSAFSAVAVVVSDSGRKEIC